MKIVCDKCQTKYSIADEKVSGKVFKIRCKKCSHIIVVKGTEAVAVAPVAHDARDDQATLAGGSDATGGSGEKVWYLVVAGEQVGPFSTAEVRARFTAGEIDGETYGWREGFADWLRLANVDEFREAVGDALGANGGETRRTDLGDMFASHAAA